MPFRYCQSADELISLTRHMDGLAEAHRAGRALALLLDFDGTLVPIVNHPDHTVLDAGARAVLESLAAHPRVTVGIISGRAIDDLKFKIGTSLLWLAGTSGLELEWRGRRLVPNDAAAIRRLLQEIVDRLSLVTALFPGSWIEEKPFGLTLHFRNIASRAGSDLIAAQRQVLRQFSGSIVATAGPAAIEIIPAVGRSKGTAVEWICKNAGADLLSLYAGDSDNDRSAFQSVRNLGGVAIGVGRDVRFPVDLRISDPGKLVAGLRHLHCRLAAE